MRSYLLLTEQDNVRYCLTTARVYAAYSSNRKAATKNHTGCSETQ
jgi:hypothetical protein